MKRRTKLTEQEWAEVFRLRCLSKRGFGAQFSRDERALLDAAYIEDRSRYQAMEGEVFDATVPFGSATRWGAPRKRRAGPDRRTHRRGHGERRGRE